MFIELAEYLRCPRDQEESYCVVLPEEMVGRSVIWGVVGCPATKREYKIENRVANFIPADAPPLPESSADAPADAQTVHALLGVTTPGGYIVLLGSAARLAVGLSELVGGVHFVGLNVPDGVEPSGAMSVLRGPSPLPLRSSMARGVVVGAEYAVGSWLAEGSRVLLSGLRVVVFKEAAAVPGTRALASGHGLWVGQKA